MRRAALHDLEAERALLGAVLVDPRVLERLERVRPGDLFGAHHRAIWRACLAVAERSPEFDTLAVRAELRARGEWGDGVESALAEAEGTFSALNVEHYASAVKRAAMRRRFSELGEYLHRKALDPDTEAEALSGELDRLALEAVDERGSDPRPLSDAVAEALVQIDAERRGEGPSRVPSGIGTLDRITGGLGRGEMFVLAARPGVGKSSLAWQWAVHGARKGFGALVFSLEMRQSELAKRWLASEARVAQSDLKRMRLSQLQMARLSDATDESSRLPVDLADASSQTIGDIRARVMRWKRKRPELALVVVDYLQLVGADVGRSATREQEVSAVARGLKRIAAECDVAVLALAQLSREVERGARGPLLSDLRESGEIEQAADAVVFIHRPKDSEPIGDEAQSIPCDLVIAKQRNGASGCIADVWFRAAHTRFEERAPGL